MKEFTVSIDKSVDDTGGIIEYYSANSLVSSFIWTFEGSMPCNIKRAELSGRWQDLIGKKIFVINFGFL